MYPGAGGRYLAAMVDEDPGQQALETKAEKAAREIEDDEDDDEAGSPFDHPAFLPVLLWIFAVWFAYDGWFNPEMEWIKFNRYGFAVLITFAIYNTLRALRELRSDREAGASGPGPSAGE